MKIFEDISSTSSNVDWSIVLDTYWQILWCMNSLFRRWFFRKKFPVRVHVASSSLIRIKACATASVLLFSDVVKQTTLAFPQMFGFKHQQKVVGKKNESLLRLELWKFKTLGIKKKHHLPTCLNLAENPVKEKGGGKKYASSSPSSPLFFRRIRNLSRRAIFVVDRKSVV